MDSNLRIGELTAITSLLERSLAFGLPFAHHVWQDSIYLTPGEDMCCLSKSTGNGM